MSDVFEGGSPPMTKAARRAARRNEQNAREAAKRSSPLKPKTPKQAEAITALKESEQVFLVGGAGTGKTYLASRHAMRKLLDGKTDKIVICRPTVAKEKHKQGFLPGGLEAKLRPWLVPVLDGMVAEASNTMIDKLKNDGRLEFLSFEHMRGRSIPDAVIILDEAQNCDLQDLRMFLTRTGENSQVIVCGDLDQIDIPNSGLETVLDMVEDFDLDADIIEFGPEDVVRSRAAAGWVRAFSRSQP